MATVVVTGANRGIGLELVRQYLQRGEQVVAACRQPDSAKELHALESDNLRITALEITSKDSIHAFCASFTPRSVSILINNAGVYGPRGVSFGLVGRKEWMEVLEVNTIAPLMLTQKFLPSMDAEGDKKLIYMSSKMGSIEDNTSGGNYIYRSSKTALNQVVKSISIDLADQGFIATALHPGWVRTDMGGPEALVDVETSARGLIQVIDGLTEKDSGSFISYDGSPIPW